MKKIIAIFISLLMLIITVPGCNQLQTESNNTESDNMEECSMENTMEELVNQNYICITELFYYGNLPYGEIVVENGAAVAEVKSDKYKTLKDIQAFLSRVYTSDEVEKLLNNYMNDKPLYFEKDGKLYLYVEQSTSAGLPVPWENFDIIIVSNSDKECKFNAIVRYKYDEKAQYEYSFKAIKEDAWKLSSVVCKPNY